MSTSTDVLGKLGVRRRGLTAAGVGAVAALGLAPFDWWFLSFPAFAAILALAARAPRAKAVAWTLWAAGFGYFGVALHWIVEPFLVDIARHGWMAPFALALMAGGMALFWALAGWVAGRVFTGTTARIWGIACVLVLTEYLRATVLTGFPWAHPGHALIGSGLLSLAAFVGPHGLTAFVLGIAAICSAFLATRRSAIAALVLLPVLVLGLFPLTAPAPPPSADAPVVRLIQPNAPQHLKWQPEMVPVFFERGLSLTGAPPDAALGPPDLVVWPETSLPVLLERSDAVRARMADASGDAAIVVGAQRFEGLRPRNTLAVFDARGAVIEIYDKHRLAPFGEYLPFGDMLAHIGLAGLAEQLAGGYQPGPGPAVLDLGPLGTVFPMICYEAVFPADIRDVVRPDWMMHITNDAWFGSFSGPYQHLALARLRAAEQGLPVLRAANTGITAVIDARGTITQSIPLNEAGYLDARVPSSLPPTVYARFGDLPIIVVVLFATIGLRLIGTKSQALRPRD